MPPNKPPPPPPVQKPGKVSVYRAIYKYEANHADELSFDEGDMIYVKEKGNDGWWKATINGKNGIIPGNYVTEDGGGESLDHPLHEAAKRGNLPFLKECIENKVSVNGLDKSGSTPLHWAARGGHAECVEALLAVSNVEVNVLNKLGDTALHNAAWKGQKDVIVMLLEKGADRNQKNGEEQTAYQLASRNPEAQQLLRPIASRSRLEDEYEESDEDDGTD